MTEFDPNDIAIIGMALRVPGASTPEEYWANLSGGVESLRTYTDEELAARGVSAATLGDPNYVKAGMPLHEALELLSALGEWADPTAFDGSEAAELVATLTEAGLLELRR